MSASSRLAVLGLAVTLTACADNSAMSRNGTRLIARYLESGPARAFFDFRDETLQLECTFLGGATSRCRPPFAQTDGFSDAQCTQPYVIPSDSTVMDGSVTIFVAGGMRSVKLVVKETQSELYDLDASGACGLVPNPWGSVWRTTWIEESALVEGKQGEVGGSPLGARAALGADGSMQRRSLWSFAESDECSEQETGAGALCVPAPLVDAKQYVLASDCQTPVAHAVGLSESLTRSIVDDGRVFDGVKVAPAEVRAKAAGGGCDSSAPVPLDLQYWKRGAEQTRVVLKKKKVEGGPAQPEFWVNESGTLVLPTGKWFDAIKSAPCLPHPTRAPTRCVPPFTAELRFKDAGCQQGMAMSNDANALLNWNGALFSLTTPLPANTQTWRLSPVGCVSAGPTTTGYEVMAADVGAYPALTLRPDRP